jgi:hypothetical protein
MIKSFLRSLFLPSTLSDTYKQSGPDAFDDDALILFLAVGSIMARTRGRDVLHKAMESAPHWRAKAWTDPAAAHHPRSTEPARLRGFVTVATSR